MFMSLQGACVNAQVDDKLAPPVYRWYRRQNLHFPAQVRRVQFHIEAPNLSPYPRSFLSNNVLQSHINIAQKQNLQNETLFKDFWEGSRDKTAVSLIAFNGQEIVSVV